MDATSTDDAYYIWRNDAQAGPYTLAQLRSMWHSGTLTGDTQYWHAALTDWASLSSIKDRLEPATPAPSSPPTKTGPQNLLVTVCKYAFGISLCVLAIIAQDAHKNYSAPVRIAPETAGIIGGLMPVALYGAGLFVWYRYFKGRPGSIIVLLGFLGAARDVGGFLARIMISL